MAELESEYRKGESAWKGLVMQWKVQVVPRSCKQGLASKIKDVRIELIQNVLQVQKGKILGHLGEN